MRGEDDFTRELESDRAQALWVAELSNDEVVVMDDGRPGVEPPSAWIRLGEYVQANNLTIRDLWLKFRSNVQRNIVPKNAEGYYFCKSALGSINQSRVLHFFLIGSLQNGKLTVQQWYVPSLVLVQTEERDVEKAGLCLIRNNRGETTTGLALWDGGHRLLAG